MTDAPSVLTFEEHGAAGDGVQDDSDALAAALRAAGGRTVVGRPGATYRLARAVEVTLQDATIDLNGATLFGDVELSPGASLLTLRDCVAVTVRAGSIRWERRVTAANLIAVEGGQWCRVEDLRADCDGAQVVSIRSGRDHAIERVRTSGGCLAIAVTTDARVRRNLIENPPGNCVNAAGGPPPGHQSGVRYTENAFRGWNRIGLEEYSPAGPLGCQAAIVRDNVFLGTGGAIWYGSTPVGFAVSVVASGALIQANHVADAVFAGIETNTSATRAVGNTVTWPRGCRQHESGLHVNSANPAPGMPAGGVIAWNSVHRAVAGVLLASRPFLSSVALAGNLVSDSHLGLVLQPHMAGAHALQTSESKIAFANAIRQRTAPGLRWTTPQQYWSAAAFAVDRDTQLVANLVDRVDGQSEHTLAEERAAGRVTMVANAFRGDGPGRPNVALTWERAANRWTGRNGHGPVVQADPGLSRPIAAARLLDRAGDTLGLVPLYANSH